MTLTDWFNKRKIQQIAARDTSGVHIDDSIGKLWTLCYNCSSQLPKKDLENNLMVCPNCDYHFRIGARERIKLIADEGTFKEMFTNIKPCDPLEFTDTQSYKMRQKSAEEKSGLDEAVVVGTCEIDGQKAAIAVMDFEYMGGSMGSVVGEKITAILEYALLNRIPSIAFTASGGARMQEGVISLFQMAKTSQALAKYREKGLYIAVLTDPTTGGVSASFASLADITIAEPNALIGFAGKRVIERTIKETLPKEFQTAEFLLDKGYIDMISDRKDLKKTLALLLRLHNFR